MTNYITDISYIGPFDQISSAPPSYSVTVRDICTREFDLKAITVNTEAEIKADQLSQNDL